MAKYKVGITEAGDAGIDLSWAKKLDAVDGAVLVTKNINSDFIKKVLEHRSKLIVHVTCTGYGGTVLEPHVPTSRLQRCAATDMVLRGFPRERVVIRVDPIIPTEKGLERALDTIEAFMKEGFNRFRISVIDMYPHARDRFKNAGLPLPYGETGFSPDKEQLADVDEMIREAREYWASFGRDPARLRIESCAEPGLREPIPCGCISSFDLALLGLDTSDVDSVGPQRPKCMCYSGKTELLAHKQRCPHGCLYCYWRD